MESVVETVRERFDVEVVVLRLLSTTTESPVMGGDVSYLAEVVGDPPTGMEASGEDAAVGDHPLRAPWVHKRTFAHHGVLFHRLPGSSC